MSRCGGSSFDMQHGLGLEKAPILVFFHQLGWKKRELAQSLDSVVLNFQHPALLHSQPCVVLCLHSSGLLKLFSIELQFE